MNFIYVCVNTHTDTYIYIYMCCIRAYLLIFLIKNNGTINPKVIKIIMGKEKNRMKGTEMEVRFL